MANHPEDVPELLRGCWRRQWIRWADGSVDDTSTVIWVQLPSLMVDVRVSARQPSLASRGSLDACSLADLATLAESESSSGYTTCTPIERSDGVRQATARWITRGHGVAFQPVSAYPEPGLLSWNDDGTVMKERAPSGAYVEEWHRVPNTDGPLRHQVRADGRQLYRAGDTAVIVRDRPTPVPRQARLDELIAEAGDNVAAVRALVDCEFSVATRQSDGHFHVEASTLPWRIGGTVDVHLR